MAIKVAEWIRVSDEGQAAPDRFGIPAQHAANIRTAEVFGLEIKRKFQVEDVSGKDIMLAPQTRELIHMMETGAIQGVIVAEFSRIARPDDLTAFELLAILQRTNTTLYLPNGPMDLRDKMGVFMATILGGVAGLERNTIRERVMRGKEQARKQGRNVQNRLPYGLDYDRKVNVWSYNEKAALVRDCFERVLAGDSNYDAMARRLGVTAPGVAAILRNPIYTGWLVFDHKTTPGAPSKEGKQGRAKRIPRLPEEIIRQQVIAEPLISQREFNAAQRILGMKREAHRREQKKGQGWAMFNGFIFCNRCGSLMTPWRTTKAQGYYYCLNRKRNKACDQPYVRVDRLESTIDTLLTTEVTSRAFASRLAMRLEQRGKDDRRAARIQRLEAEQKAFDSKRDRVLELFTDGDISKDEKNARLARIAEQGAKVSEELARERESALPNMAADQIVTLFQQFSDWEFLQRAERRSLLSVTIPRFRVDGDTVTSFYRLLDAMEVPAMAGHSAIHHKESSLKRTFLVMKKTGRKYDRAKRVGSIDDAPAQRGVWIDVSAA